MEIKLTEDIGVTTEEEETTTAKVGVRDIDTFTVVYSRWM